MMLPMLPRFLRNTRGGATAITAVAVTIMSVAGAALVTDHLWLVDQRDTLKAAADAAGVAATLELNRQLALPCPHIGCWTKSARSCVIRDHAAPEPDSPHPACARGSGTS